MIWMVTSVDLSLIRVGTAAAQYFAKLQELVCSGVIQNEGTYWFNTVIQILCGPEGVMLWRKH